ncbi:MAG: hypothetical protein FOGNACKC_01351 [Anaerolineae bacterium]|nr:hypothetical protein [Anaerolineae bacterium]
MMMKAHYLPALALVSGLALILVGVLTPSATVIESIRSLRASPAELQEQLLWGATFFKISLTIFGVLVIILSRLPIWQQPAQADAPPSAAPQSKLQLVILAALLLAALALRLYRLDAGLWHDEVLAYTNYVRLPFGEIISTYKDQNQHFLFTLLAHLAFNIFGESSWALRLPAVLFGVGSIWALYLVGRQVTSTREALLAAALLTFSYHHIWFSQNGRGYSGLLFWALVATWFFLRGRTEDRAYLWLFYAPAAALGVYTNTTMIFVIAGHFIVYLLPLLTRRSKLWPDWGMGFLLGFCLAGFFTLLLHALPLPQVLAGLAGEESTVPAWKNPMWALLEVVRALRIGFAGGLVATAALVVFGAGFISYARSKMVVVQLLVIPTVLCAAAVIGLGHHLWPRLFIFAMGFAALVTIRGLMLLGQTVSAWLNVSPTKSAWAGTALGLALIFVSSLSIPLVYGPKQDFQGALDLVEAERQPGDAIVTVGLATFTYQNFYQTDWREIETLDALNAVRAQATRTWLVYTFPPEVQSVYPEIMASIQHDFKVRQEFYGTVGSGTIFVCLSDLPAANPAAVSSEFGSEK